jgi:ribose 5-phosphate isomerase RpiB
MDIAVAFDHASFSLKQTVLTFLRGLGHTVEDSDTCNTSRLAKIEATESKCGAESLIAKRTPTEEFNAEIGKER